MRKLLFLFLTAFTMLAVVNKSMATECPNAEVIPAAPTLPLVLNLVCGTTNDINSSTAISCGNGSYMGGQEALYVWTPTHDYADVTFEYNGVTWTGVFLFEGCPTDATSTCIGNVTSGASSKTLAYVGNDQTSGTTISLTAGVTYYIMVDTWPSPINPCPGTLTINGTILLPCTGTPNPGNTLSTHTTVGPATNFTLSLENATPGSGVTYQWQSSADGAIWNDVGPNAPEFTTTQTADTYYRCEVTCDVSTGTSTPIFVTMAPKLAGGTIYPINNVDNAPIEFANITQAVNYLILAGVTGTGQVIFELGDDYDSSTEPAPINITEVSGTSELLGITFRPAPSVTALTSIAGAASPNQHAIQISGSYITLDGRAGGTGTGRDWTVRVTGTTLAQMAVRIANPTPVTAINVRNLIMEASATGTTGAIMQIGTSGTTANTISNVVIENNLIRSETTANIRGYGITTGSASSSASNTGLVIRNNEITRFATRGINLTVGFPGQEVYGNKIYHTEAHAGSFEFAGIYFSTASAPGSKIYNNYIYDIQIISGTTTSINGIQVLIANATGDPVVWFNNRVDIGSGITMTTIPIYGIHHSSTLNTYLHDFYFNSVRISGVAASGSANSAAFRKAGGNFLNISNNIFFNDRSGGTGTHWAIAINATTFASISNNNYFSTHGVLGTTNNFPSGNRINLVEWNANVTSDQSSVSQNPNFIAGLKIDATIATQLESGGIVIAGIDTDFEGTPRYPNTGYPEKPGFPAGAPDIGAFEFAGELLDLIPPIISYTPLQNTVSTASRTIDNVSITDLSEINVTSNKPRVYFKKSTDPNNETAWQYTETTDIMSPFSFNIDVALLGGVTLGDVIQYFIVAQDEATTPNVAINSGTFASIPTSVNLQAAAFPIGGAINSYEIKSGIGGIIYVGLGETYESFTNAGGLFEAINNAVVTSNITAKVVTNTSENGTHALNEWANEGLGVFSLTIEPSTATMMTISGSSAGGLITLNGADNVTIDGSFSGTGRYLTIENTNTLTNTAAIRLISLGADKGATNVDIKNCVIKTGDIGTTTSINTFGIYIGGTTISNTATGADNDNVTIEGNHIMKARYGIYARGESVANANDNLNIINNEIGSDDPAEYVTFRGIEITNAENPLIKGNYIHSLKQTLASSNAAIDIGTGVSGAEISNNIITGVWSESTGGWGAWGINFSSSSNVTNNSIINNTISDIRAVNYSTGSTTFNAFGIRLTGGTNTQVLYNSVFLSGDITIVSTSPTTQPNSAALIVTSSVVTGLNVINNVLANTQTFVSGAPKTYSIWVPASYTGFATIDYNDYYGDAAVPPTTYHVGRVGTVDYTSLNDWEGFTGQDANSMNADPLFTSNTDLIPQTGSPLAAKGTPVVGVNEDIEGVLRHVSNPTIGAYELPAYDLFVEGVLMPTATYCYDGEAVVTITIGNHGPLDVIEQFLASYSYNDVIVTETVNQTVVAGGSIDYTFTAPIDFNLIGLDSTIFVNTYVFYESDKNQLNDTLGIDVTFNYIPDAPIIVNDTVPYTGVAVLVATANANEEVFWYEDMSSTNPIHFGTHLTTQPITADVSYFVEAHSGTAPDYLCHSERIEIKAVLETPICYFVTNVSVDISTQSTAQVSFTPGGSETSWALEFGEQGYTQGTGVVDTSFSTTYTFDGLTAGYTYDFYVKALCGTTNSIWVGPYQFKAECNQYDVPLFENFDNVITPELPICWNALVESTSPGAAVITFEQAGLNYSDPNSIMMYGGTDFDENAVTILTSPEMANDLDELYVKFNARHIDASNVILGSMADPTDASTFNAIETFNLTNNYDEYSKVLKGINTTDRYIAFMQSQDYNKTTANVGEIADPYHFFSDYYPYGFKKVFNVMAPTGVTIESVDVVFDEPTGTPFTIVVEDNTGAIVQSHSGTVTGSYFEVQTIPVNFTLPQGNGYKMRFTNYLYALHLTNFFGNHPYPYTITDAISITHVDYGGTAYQNYYSEFYNWAVSIEQDIEAYILLDDITIDKSLIATYVAGPNGHITGLATQYLIHGANTEYVTAEPNNSCYAFEKWSDGSTDNPRYDIDVNADFTVLAQFKLRTIEHWTTQVICDGNTYYFGDLQNQELTVAGDYTGSFITPDGCDSTVYLTLIVNPTYEFVQNATICQGQTYTWQGNTYSTAGTYYAHYWTQEWCDSIYVLNLYVRPTFEHVHQQAICQGETFTWRGNNYTASGTYYDAYKNQYNCDSIYVLELTVNPKYLFEETRTACDEYLWRGHVYTESGVYYDSLLTAQNCPFVYKLNLTINSSFMHEEDVTICDNEGGYEWRGNIYNVSGTYYDSYMSAKNCDSTYVLHLVVNPAHTFVYDITICDNEGGYEWRGDMYYVEGVYYDSLLTINDCDSVFVLNLTVNTAYEFATYDTICDNIGGYNWRGMVFNQTGTYYDSFMSELSCDSVYVLHLVVNPTYEFVTSESVCEGIIFNWRGGAYDIAGTYYDSLLTVNGCDSVYVLNLTYYNTITTLPIYKDICNGEFFPWRGNMYDATGIYRDTLFGTDPSACYIVHELHLTVYPTYADTITMTICQGDSYEWYGNFYTDAGYYTEHFLTINNCDSLKVLELIVNPSYIFVDSVVVCDDGQGYLWRDSVYMLSGIHYDSLTTAGTLCDSIYVLNLTINPTYAYVIYDTICEGDVYMWIADGNEYTQAGTYNASYLTINDCDSIYTLHLTVNPVYEIVESDAICAGDIYTWRGYTLTATGTYYDYLQTVNGCDSTYVLHLVVNTPTTATITEVVCNSYTAPDNQVYTQSGVYNAFITNVAGCDSIITIHLTVNHSTVSSITETVCDSYSAPDGQVYTTSGIYTAVIPNAVGCDSTITINLTVKNSSVNTITEVVCDSYTAPDGQVYTTSGVYTAVIPNTIGCDSTITINLTVNYSTHSTISATVCDSYTAPDGQVYLTSGIYTAVIPNTAGCDSIITINLVVDYTMTSTTNKTICDGDVFAWRGNNYTVAGTYYDSLVPSYGCPIIYVLNLHVNPSYLYEHTEIICAGDTFTWRGNDYAVAGIYYDAFQTINGCDSIYMLNLIVKPHHLITDDVAICDGDVYTWRGNDYTLAGVYYDSLHSTFGCDSIFMLTLTVNNVYEYVVHDTICEGDIYEWFGSFYTLEDTYYHVLQTQYGCDSTFVLHLTVFDLPIVEISGLDSEYCEYNAAVTMTGTPAGGIFSGPGVSGNVFDPSAAGLGTWTIVYTYTDANACINFAEVTVVVDECAGIADGNSANLKINVYPNPSNGNFMIELHEATAITLYNALGAVIYYNSFTEGTHQLNFNHLADGVYFIKAESKKTFENIRIVIQK